MKFIAEKVHVKGDVEIPAPFMVLLIFSWLGHKVSGSDLWRAKETAPWDHKGSSCSLQDQGETTKREPCVGSGLLLGGQSR